VGSSIPGWDLPFSADLDRRKNIKKFLEHLYMGQHHWMMTLPNWASAWLSPCAGSLSANALILRYLPYTKKMVWEENIKANMT
jgi:hypothetical protein